MKKNGKHPRRSSERRQGAERAYRHPEDTRYLAAMEAEEERMEEAKREEHWRQDCEDFQDCFEGYERW